MNTSLASSEARNPTDWGTDAMQRRITELLQSLERVKRSSELKQRQQEDVIKALKRDNA